MSTNTMKTFLEVIADYRAKIDDEVALLPLCHTTTSGYLSEIMQSLRATPQLCDEYRECLLYFFYGKASYLTDKKLDIYTDDPPFTLIFEHHQISSPNKRLLPFDSGGYPRYKLQRGMRRERFTQTPARIEDIQAMVKLIYGCNSNYLKGKVAFDNLELFKDWSFEIQELHNVYQKVRQGQDVEVGDQLHTLEVQTDAEVPFKPTYLVMPYQAFCSPIWQNQIRALDPAITVLYYGKEELEDADGILTAMTHQVLMRKKVKEVIKRIMSSNNVSASNNNVSA